MEVKELQNRINEIIEQIDKKTKVEHNSNSTFIHVVEELGEIAKEINKPNIRNEKLDTDKLEEEIADVLLLTTRLANVHNINIENAILGRIEKLKQRHNL
jgi:NTP pyrophosphatase (non-canonical NTP hydrolase)